MNTFPPPPPPTQEPKPNFAKITAAVVGALLVSGLFLLLRDSGEESASEPTAVTYDADEVTADMYDANVPYTYIPDGTLLNDDENYEYDAVTGAFASWGYNEKIENCETWSVDSDDYMLLISEQLYNGEYLMEYDLFHSTMYDLCSTVS